MSALGLTRGVRNFNRLVVIVRVLTQHGFGDVVERLNLARFVPFHRLRGKHLEEERTEAPGTLTGRRLVRVCNELGPTFVKLGQLLSTRPDLLPPDIVHELRALQDQVAPFETGVARRIIEADLNRPVHECFREFGAVPIASGSIGQVYRAVTRDGINVVVKVKRPGVDETIKVDMQLLRRLAEAVEQFVPELASYRPTLIAEEFAQVMQRELDYINEASTTMRFHDALADDPDILIPYIRWELTSTRVLTMTALDGVNIEAIAADGHPMATEIDRPLLAERLANLYLKQFFDLGVFHADPHPGNILITPPARIGLIDFGQTGVLDDELATQLVVMLMAAVERDVELVVDILLDLGAIGRRTDRAVLGRMIRLLLDKYHGLPLKRLDPVTILTELFDIIRRNDVTLPRDLVLVLKALATVAGTALNLNPELDLLALLRPRMRRLIAARFSPRRLKRSASLSAWHLAGVLRTAPRQMRAVLRKLSTGEWQLNVRHENLDRLAQELDRSSNRLAFSIVIAAVVVGSSVVLSADPASDLFGIPLRVLGILGYVFAIVLGALLIWAIIRSGRLY
jgi:ubiquinone biosynthesis protein